MAYTSEIDKLEARFRENPKGRNFAPLADAYRKAGLIDNAIELCQNGLKLHPDYVSAYIVYARCLIDKKDDAGAQDVFRKVLALDGENIIALRVLAEIAERHGRSEEAVEWLTRLLNADPMNGDAAEVLARAKAKGAVAPPSVAAATIPMPAMPEKAPDAIEVETFDAAVGVNPAAHAAAKAEGLEVQEEVELNAQEIERVEVEGLARTQYEGSGMFKLDSRASADTEPAPPEAVDEGGPEVMLPLILPDDVPAAAPAASARPAAPAPPAPPVPPAPPAPPPVPAAVALSDDDGAVDAAALSQAEPVLTETMAELYLKQGHEEDALRVYQALLAQRPGDPRLRATVERLSGPSRKGAGVSAQAFLRGIWAGRAAQPAAPPAPPAPPAPAAPSPQPPPEPTTLDTAFEAAGPPPGEPTHAAQDNISLDSVFGDEAARRPRAGPPGEAPPAGEGAADGAAPPAGFSFDQFFAGATPGSGADAAGAPRGPHDPGAAGGARSSGRTPRPPAAEDETEADQFQQWLKKLKS